MKGKTIAVCIVVFLVIIVTGSVFFLSKSQEVMTTAQGIIGEELSKAVGSLVTVGKVEITAYNTITVQGLTIYDKQAQTVLVSDKIMVTYHPLAILRGQTAAEAISAITVEKPTLWLTQSSSGRWNVQDLLQDDNETKCTLNSKIILVDGKALLSVAGAAWTVENVNGSLDFAHNPTIGLELQATYNGETVKAKGSINRQGRSSLTLKASELAVADYQAFLPKGPLALVGGSVKNVDLTVIQDQGNLEWTGATDLAGVDIDIDGIPVRKVEGNLIFTNQNMYVFAAATIFDQPIDVRGSVRTDTSQPVVDLVLSSTAFDPSVIKSELPITGKAAFKLKVTGTTANPIIAGDVSLAKGDILGYAVSNIQTNLYIVDQKVTINEFSGDMLGGNVTATGTVEPEVAGYDISLQAHQIDMGVLANVLPASNGHGDVTAKIKGAGSLADAEVQGTVAIGAGEMAGVDFQSLGMGFYYHQGVIDLDYANLDLGHGLVTASGKIDHQNMNLTAYASGISLQELDKQGTGLISGNGDFVAKFTGTLSAPEGTVDFTATNGQACYQPFTQATGTIHFNLQQVVVNEFAMIDGVTTHKIQGTIGLQGQPTLNLSISSKQARAENIIKLLAPDEKITGNVDNEMIVTGPLDNLSANGQLYFKDGTIRGQLISKGQVTYKREQGVTTISECSVDSLNTQIKLAGSMTANNELNFDIAAQDIDMGKLTLKLPYPLSGQGQFTGKLTGTLSAPIFDGQFAAKTLTVNNQEVKEVTGIVKFNGNEIEVPELSFMQGIGKFSAVGGYVMDTREIYGSFDIGDAELGPILAVCNLPDRDIHGYLNGHIRVSGTMDQPNVWLTGDLKAGRVKHYPVESITMDVALENNVLTINELSASQGIGVLMARGKADLNGTVDVEVGGRDIDAGLVTALLNSKIEPTGKMNFAAQISGVASNPQTAISLEILNGGVGDATFDSLYGLFLVDKDDIHVNQVLLKKGLYRASAYGVIPVDALSSDGQEQGSPAEQMDLKVRLDAADLSILPLFTKEVSWATGATQGEVNVAGTLQKPSVTGQITVHDGVVKLAAVASPIQKVGVDISLEGDTINVREFDGHVGNGLYSLTGTAKLLGTKISDYDFSLVLDKPELKSKYFTGTVEGDLHLNNTNHKPQLSGKLLFENDVINIPIIPQMVASEFDIGLNVEMRVGKKVRFYNPYLYDIIAQGRLKFAGSTREPDVTGGLVAIRGTVNYLRTEFKVSDASASFKKFSNFVPDIHLNAETNLQQVTVNLAVDGPATGMKCILTSDPGMSQQDLLSLLTLRSRYTDKSNSTGLGKDEVVSALGAGLQMGFMSEIEGEVGRTLGLDEFRVVQDTTSDIITNREDMATPTLDAYNVQMTKYLTDKILLMYTTGLNYNKSSLALRYSLDRRINLNASIDDQQNKWIGIEARYKF